MKITLDRTWPTWQRFTATVKIDGLWATVVTSKRATPERTTTQEGYLYLSEGGVSLEQEDGDISPLIIGWGAVISIEV